MEHLQTQAPIDVPEFRISKVRFSSQVFIRSSNLLHLPFQHAVICWLVHISLSLSLSLSAIDPQLTCENKR